MLWALRDMYSQTSTAIGGAGGAVPAGYTHVSAWSHRHAAVESPPSTNQQPPRADGPLTQRCSPPVPPPLGGTSCCSTFTAETFTKNSKAREVQR